MLARNLEKGAVKGTVSAQPFVDDDPQCILITGQAGLALELFGGRVTYCASHLMDRPYFQTLGVSDQNQAKITEQDLVVLSHQHILRFHVAMSAQTSWLHATAPVLR